MNNAPNHTVTPLILIASTASVAVQRFGPSAEDCRLATYDEVLSGAHDGVIQQSRFVGIASGEDQHKVMKHVLTQLGRRDDAVEVVLEVQGDDQRDLGEKAEIASQFPSFSLAGTDEVGRAKCLRLARNVAASPVGGEAAPQGYPLLAPVDRDGSAVDEFTSGAVVARLRIEVERLRRDQEETLGRLERTRQRLKVSRKKNKDLRTQVQLLRGSRGVRLALAVAGGISRVAAKLGLSPRVFVGLTAALGILVALTLGVGLVALGGRAALGSALVATLAVLVLTLLVALNRRVVRELGVVSRRLTRLENRSKANDRTRATALRNMGKRSRSQYTQQMQKLDEVGQKLDGAREDLGEAVRAETAPIGERLEALSVQVDSAQEQLPTWFRQFEQRYNRRNVIERGQTEAALNLYALAPPVSAAVPAMGGWAASPDVLLLLVDELLTVRPRTVVECGSGVSTLWLALMIQKHALPTRLIALEHDEGFAQKTRSLLRKHGLEGLVEVRHAPLVAHGEGESQWYDTTALKDVDDVGLMFVDGPPADTSELARMPAVPEMLGRMAQECTVVLDDLVRAEEKQVARAWRDLLPEFSYEEVALEKGAAVFRRG